MICATRSIVIQISLLAVPCLCMAQEAVEPAVVLKLNGAVTDPAAIDFDALPKIAGEHAVVCPSTEALKFQLHNYLAHYDGKYWCLFSHGPVVEDVPTQFISYATSDDGLKWSEAKPVMPAPKEPLCLHCPRAVGSRRRAAGPGRALSRQGGVRREQGIEARSLRLGQSRGRVEVFGTKLFDDAINNFAPQKLQNGEWLMTRRDARFNVYMLAGGVKSLEDWQSFPVVKRLEIPKFAPDEPFWWQLPDGRLHGLFRDNGGSSRLFPVVFDRRRPHLDATADHELSQRVEQVLPAAARERPLGDDLERQPKSRPSLYVPVAVGRRRDVHQDGPARNPVDQSDDVPVPARHRARRPPADRRLAEETANRSLQSAAVGDRRLKF